MPEDKLTKCAGYSQATSSISFIISPAAGAFFYSIWPLEKIVAIDIVGAIIACITVAAVRIPRPAASVKAITKNFIQEMKEGYLALRETKGLFSLLWIGMLYMFMYMPINALFPLMSMQYFNGTPAHAAPRKWLLQSGCLLAGSF